MAPESSESIGTAAQWIQAGGLALFSAAVWVEVRALRAVLGGIKDALASLLERDRMRTGPVRIPTE